MPGHTRTLALLLVALAACGGGDDNGNDPPDDPLVVARTATASGNAQTGAAGTALPEPLRVLVTRGGTPVSGTAVAWAAPGTGASVNPANATTDANGIATTTWTLPQAAGAATAAATVAGATGSPVSFTATGTAGAATTLEAAGGTGQTGVAGQPLTNALQVRAEDQFGNPVAGVNVAWAVTVGGGSVAPSAGTTSATGVASTAFTLGITEGTHTATATAAGLTGSPVTFNAEAEAAVATSQVEVGNDFFQPAAIQVSPGTTVTWTWTNTGAIQHSVESTGSPSFTSSAILTGNGMTHEFEFTQAGTYTYQCAVHGAAMTGTVVVQ